MKQVHCSGVVVAGQKLKLTMHPSKCGSNDLRHTAEIWSHTEMIGSRCRSGLGRGQEGTSSKLHAHVWVFHRE